jgi:Luciferase-like monooxygenase
VSIQIGVILPTSTPDPARPILGDVRESARLADEAGLDSVWSTDHVIASAPILDSTVVLATAAAVTGRVKIGFGVMLLALRPVAWAAKQISTLQYVSGDRVLPSCAGSRTSSGAQRSRPPWSGPGSTPTRSEPLSSSARMRPPARSRSSCPPPEPAGNPTTSSPPPSAPPAAETLP